MNAELSIMDSEPVASQTSTAFAEGDTATHTPSFLQQVYHLLALTGLAMASYAFISHFVLQSVQVVGVSMVPTLHNADHYFLNRWVYYVREPKRGDLVVLKDPSDGGYAVKRIVGLSGESIRLKNGLVYINGKKLAEPYLEPGTPTFGAKSRDASVTCGQGRYFVMGDNRCNSLDSRAYGPVRRDNILGVIIH